MKLLPEPDVSKVRTYRKLRIIPYTKDGCFYASCKGKNLKRLKLMISKDDDSLTYDLNQNGSWELFPLQLGNGSYKISLYENVRASLYENVGSIKLSVKLSDPNNPFLLPNQYVLYSEKSPEVKIAESLQVAGDQKATYRHICTYVRDNFAYDFIKAATVKSGVLPDLEGLLQKKMGICQDLSALTVAMLRSQDIPSKLVIGKADQQRHAWVETNLDGKTARFDPTAQLNAIAKVKKYEMERVY